MERINSICKELLVCGLLLVSSISVADETTHDVGSLKSPIVTHGENTSRKLINGDLFELPHKDASPSEKGLVWSIKSSKAESWGDLFTINQQSFGSEENFELTGLNRKLNPQGVTASSANSKILATTCAEDFWDANLFIAGSGDTEGDLITLTLQDPKGSNLMILAQFKKVRDQLQVTELNPFIDIFEGDRYAASSNKKRTLNQSIPMNIPAGEKGNRTQLITVAFSMASNSPFMMGLCAQMGLEIERKSGQGSTSAIFTDIVVIRSPEKMETNVDYVGLLEGLLPPYPVKPSCAQACPAGGAGVVCRTLCFKSPAYWITQTASRASLPSGLIVIGGEPFLINTTSSSGKAKVRGALTNNSENPLAKLNKQYVAAQLGLLAAGGSVSPNVLGALSSPLSCYKLFERTGLNPAGISLSTEITVTPATQLKVLFEQGRIAAISTSTEPAISTDRENLAALFKGLYNEDVIASCTNPSMANSQATKSVTAKLTKKGKKKLRKRTIRKPRLNSKIPVETYL